MTSAETRKRPHPASGLALFFGVIAAGLVAATMLSEDALLVAMPLVMLAATAIATRAFGVDATETLHLRLPAASDLLMAFPLAISFFVLDDQLAGISHALYPVPEETQAYFRRVLTAETPSDWFMRIATIGVGAAISEELMFRGFIQSAFLVRLRRPAAVMLTAFLFMLLHVQYLPVLAAGLVLGFVTLATRSIVIPVLVHFANNTIQLLLLNLAKLETLGDPLWIPPTILLPAAAIFILTCAYYARRLEPAVDAPAASSQVDEREGGDDRITIPYHPAGAPDELASVPKGRRRLGWAVVVASVLVGVAVLVALFSWSVYYIYPERFHESGIEVLQSRALSVLDPSASHKSEEISAAFEALSALNEGGQLELRDLASVARTLGELSADGTLDASDADALITGIRETVRDRTRPKNL